MITVCEACSTASCWHGDWMCEKATHAGSKELPRRKLLELSLENPEYFSDATLKEVTGQ